MSLPTRWGGVMGHDLEKHIASQFFRKLLYDFCTVYVSVRFLQKSCFQFERIFIYRIFRKAYQPYRAYTPTMAGDRTASPTRSRAHAHARHCPALVAPSVIQKPIKPLDLCP